MQKYLEMVSSAISAFQSVEIQYISREENTEADELSRLSVEDIQAIDTAVYVEFIDHPSSLSEVVAPIEVIPCWYDDILRYLRTGELPLDRKEARRIQAKSRQYTIHNGVLYRRSYTRPLLRCLRADEAVEVMREIHEGICGRHQGGRSLFQKILRQGYHWPKMHDDCIELVRKCDKCQFFAPVPHAPAAPLQPITSPLPFAIWGMDIIGPFPQATYQRKYIIVAIDYFTKWVEVEAVSKIDTVKVEKFFRHSVVYRFGIPRMLITDNGTQFTSSHFAAFCEEFRIDHRFGSVGHPQTSGQTEATNKTILCGLKKMVADQKEKWVDMLPSIVWSYRTTSRTPTGETPFMLTFGTEAVVPVEVFHPTFRILNFDELTNSDNLRTNLDDLEDVRESAAFRMANYQQTTARHYDKAVRLKQFKVGDLVLRKTAISDPLHQGKMSKNWEGPYRVLRTGRPGSYKLTTLGGEEIPRTWNAVNLRKFYQ